MLREPTLVYISQWLPFLSQLSLNLFSFHWQSIKHPLYVPDPWNSIVFSFYSTPVNGILINSKKHAMTWKSCNEVFFCTACNLQRVVWVFRWYNHGGLFHIQTRAQQKRLCWSATRQRTNEETVREQSSRCKALWVCCVIAAGGWMESEGKGRLCWVETMRKAAPDWTFVYDQQSLMMNMKIIPCRLTQMEGSAVHLLNTQRVERATFVL